MQLFFLSEYNKTIISLYGAVIERSVCVCTVGTSSESKPDSTFDAAVVIVSYADRIRLSHSSFARRNRSRSSDQSSCTLLHLPSTLFFHSENIVVSESRSCFRASSTAVAGTEGS